MMKSKKGTCFLVKSKIQDKKVAERVAEIFMQEEESVTLYNEVEFLKDWNKAREKLLQICSENLSQYCQTHLDNTFYQK